MKKNLVRKILPLFHTTWTAPAGVEEVIVTVLDRFDELSKMAKGQNGYALRKTGAAFAWGGNSFGELGDGTNVSKSTPVPVSGGFSFVSIYGGSNHAVALRADGNAYAWGIASTGQIGDNTIVNKSVPTLVVGGHSFIQVTAGTGCCGGLKIDGSAWTWGWNNIGQLGDSTSANKSSPVPVVGGHSFVQLVLSENNVTSGGSAGGLKSNGQLWTWGRNTNGQLGDGTTTSTSSPVQTIGGHSFVNFAMGTNHVIALKANGEAWTWGQNNSGQLGDGNSDLLGGANQSSPVQVIGGHSFIKVSAGLNLSVALKSNGQVWTWGANTLGELGDGTTSSQSSPVQVIGGHSFISMEAGWSSTVALKSNGQIWSWGRNSTGQLGDNTLINKSSPVQVVTTTTFEAGVQYANKQVFTVIPGTTYNFNAFFTSITPNLMLSNAQNNSYIVLEYYA